LQVRFFGTQKRALSELEFEDPKFLFFKIFDKNAICLWEYRGFFRKNAKSRGENRGKMG
jgi:hypothetical protein